MPSNKITNNLKVFNENKNNILNDTNYSNDSERINGFQAGDPIRSEIVNKVLRDTSLVASAFIEALKQSLTPGEGSDVTNPISVGTDTDFNDLVLMIQEALRKVPPANLATIAMTGSFNDLRDKPDMMLRSVVTSFNQTTPGFYSIISSGSDRPLGTETLWGLIVYQAGTAVIQQIATSKTNNRVFLRSKTGSNNWTSWEEILRFSDKTNTLSSSSTNDKIPGAKAVVDYVEGRKWKLIRPDSLGWTVVAGYNRETTTIELNTSLSIGDVVVLELDGTGVDQSRVDRPFLVQIPLTHLPSSDPTNKGIFKAEYLSYYHRGGGNEEDIYQEAKFFVWFSYNGSNLYFKSLGTAREYGSQEPIVVTYNKHSYFMDDKYPVKSEAMMGSLSVRRIWLVK
jgi:hypothetical protein